MASNVGAAAAGRMASGLGAVDGWSGLATVAARITDDLDQLAHVTGRWGRSVVLDQVHLLTARAEEAGFVGRGRTSANGSCRLFPSGDSWAAVNLARPQDVETVAALLGVPLDDVESGLRAALCDANALDTLDTLHSLEVPAARLGEAADVAPITISRPVPPGPPTHGRPFVLDLSAMWAGPLCASILGRAGARVVKVESPDRPDGARLGPPRFFAELHRGQELRTLRFREPDDRAVLDQLFHQADVVVESSRPRALEQLGIDAQAWVADRAGRTWISITGYGRRGAHANRVAFGDDAAVAGGLVARGDDGPVFCGDAIADPLTGVYAGLAAAASVAAGGGQLIDVTMAGVAAHVNRMCSSTATLAQC